MKRLEWIDSLKGIAILMVIAVHMSQALNMPTWAHLAASFGAMGVQLFFLLSAYCLCMTWKGTDFSRISNIVAYFTRKYSRLAPWYIVGICLYAVLACVGIGPTAIRSYTMGNVISNVFLVNGLVPSAQNTIVPGGWSISCIALFVFAAPLLMYKCSGKNLAICLFVSVMGVIFSAIGYRFLGWSRFYAYCSPFNQAVVFFMGVAYWHLTSQSNYRVTSSILLGAMVFFLVLSVAAVMFDRENAIFYRHILISFSFLAAMSLASRYKEVLNFRGLLWLGRHSYEVFIFHFAVIKLVQSLFC